MTKVILRSYPPPMKNFSIFEMTKMSYSSLPPPCIHNWKTSDFDVTNSLRSQFNPPPNWKTSDLRWPKFTPVYPKTKNLCRSYVETKSGNTEHSLAYQQSFPLYLFTQFCTRSSASGIKFPFSFLVLNKLYFSIYATSQHPSPPNDWCWRERQGGGPVMYFNNNGQSIKVYVMYLPHNVCINVSVTCSIL